MVGVMGDGGWRECRTPKRNGLFRCKKEKKKNTLKLAKLNPQLKQEVQNPLRNENFSYAPRWCMIFSDSSFEFRICSSTSPRGSCF